MGKREDRAAFTIQAEIRARNVRRSDVGCKVKEKNYDRERASDEQSKKEAMEAMAKRMADAEETFGQVDKGGDGTVDKAELTTLLQMLLKKEGIAFDERVVPEFIETEFDDADVDDDNMVSFSEFIEYYNTLVDRIQEGDFHKALRETKKKVEMKVSPFEEAATFMALQQLRQILGDESVKWYTGLTMNGLTPLLSPDGEGAPNPALGMTTRGLVFDLSPKEQKLITPWGAMPISYRLTFPGYAVGANTPPQGAGERTQGGGTSLFLELSKRSTDLLSLRHLANKAHFLVIEVCDERQPRGEVMADPTPEAKAAAAARFKTMLGKLEGRTTLPALPAELLGEPNVFPYEGEISPLINTMLGRCAFLQEERIEEKMKVRKAITEARKPFSPEDFPRALRYGNNDVIKACEHIVKFDKSETKLVDEFRGDVTRAQACEALMTTTNDYDMAFKLLKKYKEITAARAVLAKDRGLHTGVGFPTDDELTLALLEFDVDTEKAYKALKVRNKAYVEMMIDLRNSTEVDAICTPGFLMGLGFYGAAEAADGREYVVKHYLGTYKRDKRLFMKWASAVTAVLRAGEEIGSPTREEAELWVSQQNGSAALAIGYRLAIREIQKQSAKLGKPDLNDCTRCYIDMGRSIDKAVEMMKMVWKIHNPKPPKKSERNVTSKATPGEVTTRKDNKPPDHLAAKCGFPSRREVEIAIVATRGTPKKLPTGEHDGGTLNLEAAVEHLVRLDTCLGLRLPYFYPWCERLDILWAIYDPREEDYLTRFPVSHEDYKAGKRGSHFMLKKLNVLVEEKGLVMRDGQWAKDLPSRDLAKVLERYDYDEAKAKTWLHSLGSIAHRHSELGIQSLAEIEAALLVTVGPGDLVDDLVVAFFESVAAVTKACAFVSPLRVEVIKVVRLYFDQAGGSQGKLPNAAEVVAAGTLHVQSFYTALADLSALALLGIVPDKDDLLHITDEHHDFMRATLFKHAGAYEPTVAFFAKYKDVMAQDKKQALGTPSYEAVGEALTKAAGDVNKAVADLRTNRASRQAAEKAKEEALKAEMQARKLHPSHY